MNTKISNIEELRSQIQLLKIQQVEHEHYFEKTKDKAKNFLDAPAKFVNKILGFVGFHNDNKDPEKVVKDDWITTLGRILLPYALNKTVLQGSGLTFRAIVTLLSQKTISGDNLNRHVVANWVDNLANWIKSTKKPRRKKDIDYGIPPDSETY